MTWRKPITNAAKIFETRRQRELIDAQSRKKLGPALAEFRETLAKKEPKGLPP